MEALNGLPAGDDYYQAAAVRLLEVIPRFSALAQVRKWLDTTARRIQADDAADTPPTGVWVRRPSANGDASRELVDVAEAIDEFGEQSALWMPEDRDWGRNPGFASWYPTYWYDPVQRTSWIRWSYRGKRQRR